jgi:hypothetical protein
VVARQNSPLQGNFFNGTIPTKDPVPKGCFSENSGFFDVHRDLGSRETAYPDCPLFSYLHFIYISYYLPSKTFYKTKWHVRYKMPKEEPSIRLQLLASLQRNLIIKKRGIRTTAQEISFLYLRCDEISFKIIFALVFP